YGVELRNGRAGAREHDAGLWWRLGRGRARRAVLVLRRRRAVLVVVLEHAELLRSRVAERGQRRQCEHDERRRASTPHQVTAPTPPGAVHADAPAEQSGISRAVPMTRGYDSVVTKGSIVVTKGSIVCKGREAAVGVAATWPGPAGRRRRASLRRPQRPRATGTSGRGRATTPTC